MKQYTGMYIVRPNATEEQVKACIDALSAIFTKDGGQVLSVEEWGMKELAYEIQDFNKGYYVKFVVNASNEAVNEYNRICNIREDVLRHIIVKHQRRCFTSHHRKRLIEGKIL